MSLAACGASAAHRRADVAQLSRGRGASSQRPAPRRTALQPPLALHRHVAGWLKKAEEKAAPAQPPPGSSDTPQTPPPAAQRPLDRALRLLRPLLPRAPLVSYESGCALADPAQVLALWEAAGAAPRGATTERVATALRHSFTCVATYAATDAPPPLPSDVAIPDVDAARSAAPPRRVLVGFARTVSDGQFAALVSDVAVLPSWRRRGVGRETLRRLLCATSAPRLGGLRDGPESLAAFPPPATRAFFARCGFRRDPRYLWMRLRAPGDAPAAQSVQEAAEEDEAACTEPADDVAAAMTALWTPLPGARRAAGTPD